MMMMMTGLQRLQIKARRLAAAAVLAIGAMAPAMAQVAVPYYGPEAFAAALQARVEAPRALEFASAAVALEDATAALCSAPDAPGRKPAKAAEATAAGQAEDPEEQPGSPRQRAREAWLDAANAWERLQALSLGATLERRSARAIDFRPARPALIKRAVGTHGRGKEPPDA